ncbi:MAG: hypothetical protein RLZZ124_1555 [Cyanobacteriota bacterium]|jgi:hypothetical protein
MAHFRALIPVGGGASPAELLPPLLQSLGLEVETPGHDVLVAFERPCAGRPLRDYVRLWADWSDIAQTGELWLEATSGESMAHSHTRCSDLLERIRTALQS